MFQLIFRKVSDVLKEQELAEKRKNDPVLNHTQDHLVRKLFNKFKKGPEGPSGGLVGPGGLETVKRDVEKGIENNSVPKTEITPPTENNTIEATEPKPEPVKPAPVKPAAGGLKGWGRLRGASSSTETKVEPVVEAATVEKKPSPVPVSLASKTTSKEAPSKSEEKNQDYQAINDRLNRIEQLISDLMVKVDDKTRSIEKSVAKVRASNSGSSSKKKPQSVTICVDSAAAGSNDNCDEQFL